MAFSGDDGVDGAGPGIGRTLVGDAQGDAAVGPAVFARHERRAWLVAGISVAVMAGELAGGAWLNSLALTSDGLHAATHAGVMLIAACAYVLARRRSMGAAEAARTLDKAALVSGCLLALAAVALGVESVQRLITPEPVRFAEAAWITALGLVVSAASAIVLRGAHERGHPPGERRDTHTHDLNLWAAYLHMVADVLTSVLALGALILGAWTGWTQLDPAVGVLNTFVVAGFSLRLLTAAVRSLFGAGAARASARV